MVFKDMEEVYPDCLVFSRFNSRMLDPFSDSVEGSSNTTQGFAVLTSTGNYIRTWPAKLLLKIVNPKIDALLCAITVLPISIAYSFTSRCSPPAVAAYKVERSLAAISSFSTTLPQQFSRSSLGPIIK